MITQKKHNYFNFLIAIYTEAPMIFLKQNPEASLINNVNKCDLKKIIIVYKYT